MKRPYIKCHMVTSIDGKVTGDFLYAPECENATEVYYELNRRYMAQGYCGFICGRATMEGSFTNCWYPEIENFEPQPYECFIPDKLTGFYAVAFDPKGKLGWKSAFIEDDDPGYDRAQIIEVLTKQASPKYLGYLRNKNIPYIFAGENEIDVPLALELLAENFGIDKILLEGGSIVNGYFLKADCVDELSLVQAPLIAGGNDKPLFSDSNVNTFTLTSASSSNGAVVLEYKKQNN